MLTNGLTAACMACVYVDAPVWVHISAAVCMRVCVQMCVYRCVCTDVCVQMCVCTDVCVQDVQRGADES